MAERRDIGFLHGVFGLAVVTQHAARDPIKPPIVPLHDLPKSIRIALERASDQFGIVQISSATFFDSRLYHELILRLLDARRGERFPGNPHNLDPKTTAIGPLQGPPRSRGPAIGTI